MGLLRVSDIMRISFCCFALIGGLGLEPLAAQSPRVLFPDELPDTLSKAATKPDRIYLRNAKGELVLVPRNQFEEFEKYLRERVNPGSSGLPAYHLESVSGSGKVMDGYAEIDWTVKAQIADPSSLVIKIPLQLGRLHLVAPPESTSGRKSQLSVDVKGYTWWLQPVGQSEHEIRFRSKLAIDRNGNRMNLHMDLPDAACNLQLEIPGAKQEVSILGRGSELLETESQPSLTLAKVRSFGGNLSVSWRPSTQTSGLDSIEIESRNTIVVRDMSQSWQGTTQLTIKAFGTNPERTVDFVLPPGVRWVPPTFQSLGDSVSIVPVLEEPNVETGNAGERQTRLRLKFTVSDLDLPIEANIAWEWTRMPKANEAMTLLGPWLPGVQRHQGTWTVEVPSSIRFVWNAAPDIVLAQQSRRNQETDVNVFQFKFLRQPFQLNATMVKDETKVRVRPQYWIAAQGDRLEMKGQIDLSVDPSQLSELRLHLGDWELEKLEAQATNASEIDFERQSDGTIVPHLDSFLESTNLAVGARPSDLRGFRFIAAKNVHRGESGYQSTIKIPQISFTLPSTGIPYTDHGSGTLTIATPRNLQLDDPSVSLVGMIKESITPEIEQRLDASIENDVVRLLNYRFTSSAESPSWTGNWSVLPQKIMVDRNTQINLSRLGKRVHQTFQYTIENEPLRRIRVILPREMVARSISSTPMRILVDGKPASWTEIPVAMQSKFLPEKYSIEDWSVIELPELRFENSVVLTFDTEQPYKRPLGNELHEESISIVTPILDVSPSIETSKVTLSIENVIDCQIQPKWLARSQQASTISRELILPPATMSLSCQVRLLDILNDQPVTVERVWLQSSFNTIEQRHRCVLRFRSKQQRIEVDIPSSFDRRRTEYFLDGKLIRPFTGSKPGVIYFDLNSSEESVVHVLELWTWVSNTKQRFAPVVANVPRLVGDTPMAPLLWQLILPLNEHLIWTNQSLTPEYLWKWNDLFFARKSDWAQLDFEKWSGGSVQPSLMSNTNQYVLSALSQDTPLEAWVVPRHLLWLPWGTLALIGSAVAVNFRFLRHPLAIALLLSAAFALAVLVPNLAILVVQWIVISLALASTVLVTRWVIDRRVQRRSVFSSRPSTIQSPTPLDSKQIVPPLAAPTMGDAPEVIASTQAGPTP